MLIKRDLWILCNNNHILLELSIQNINQGGFFFLNQIYQNDMVLGKTRCLSWKKVGLKEEHTLFWIECRTIMHNSFIFPPDNEYQLIWSLNPIRMCVPYLGYLWYLDLE
jgi:hypothetical protein